MFPILTYSCSQYAHQHFKNYSKCGSAIQRITPGLNFNWFFDYWTEFYLMLKNGGIIRVFYLFKCVHRNLNFRVKKLSHFCLIYYNPHKVKLCYWV